MGRFRLVVHNIKERYFIKFRFSLLDFRFSGAITHFIVVPIWEMLSRKLLFNSRILDYFPPFSIGRSCPFVIILVNSFSHIKTK